MTAAEYRQQQADAMTEAQLQVAIIGTGRSPGLAQRLGWDLAYHTHRSDRSPAGFPDLVLVHPRAARIEFAELKRQSPKAKTSPAQDAWLEGLRAVEEFIACHASNDALAPSPFGVHLWRPLDLLDGTIERVLRRVD
jgi:hypothetical protein